MSSLPIIAVVYAWRWSMAYLSRWLCRFRFEIVFHCLKVSRDEVRCKTASLHACFLGLDVTRLRLTSQSGFVGVGQCYKFLFSLKSLTFSSVTSYLLSMPSPDKRFSESCTRLFGCHSDGRMLYDQMQTCQLVQTRDEKVLTVTTRLHFKLWQQSKSVHSCLQVLEVDYVYMLEASWRHTFAVSKSQPLWNMCRSLELQSNLRIEFIQQIWSGQHFHMMTATASTTTQLTLTAVSGIVCFFHSLMLRLR